MTVAQMNTEIAALMQLFPLKYDKQRYNSAVKRFRIILEELYNMGIVARIVGGTYQNKYGKLRYRYQVEVNFQIVRFFGSSRQAKLYLCKLYLKTRKAQHEKETKKAG